MIESIGRADDQGREIDGGGIDRGVAVGRPTCVEQGVQQISRVGAFVGSTVDAQALDYARKTADNTTLLGRTAGRIESVISRMEPATV